MKEFFLADVLLKSSFPAGNALKQFEAEWREPSGELMPQAHRRACGLAPCRDKDHVSKEKNASPVALRGGESSHLAVF